MIINLTIPDDLYTIYLNKYGTPKLYAKLKEAIDLFKDVEAHDRVLVLSGENRRQIEHLLQTTIDSPEKLIRQIKLLNEVSVQDVAIEFTPEELARIEAQAGFHGKTRKAFIVDMIEEIKGVMLEHV